MRRVSSLVMLLAFILFSQGAVGRLTHADVAGTPLGLSHLAYQYDTHGRVTQKTQQLGSIAALSTNTHYNALGQKDQVTLPSGAVIAYTYGADGRVLTITVNGITIVKDIMYFPFGDVESWTESTSNGGAPYTRSYDTDGRVSSFRDGSVSRHVGYDPASRVTALADFGSNVTANWTVGYDNQDRLISANNAASSGTTSGVNEGFAYDATGNRTSATNAGTATSYTTDPASNHLSQVGSASRTYDAAGNTTDWVSPQGAIHATYNARNRLSQAQVGVSTASYAYDAWGERVGKNGTGAETQFVYDDDGHLQGEYDQTSKPIEETIWLDDTPVATLKLKPGATTGGPTGNGSATQWQGLSAGGVEVFWIEPDQLDSPRAIVNQNHLLIWQWDSDPFGTTLPNQNPSNFGAFTYNLRFPGQYFDQETQTHYNYFRDYEPGTGRYVESDPIGTYAGVNTYSYVLDHPLDGSDDFGLCTRRLKKLFGGCSGMKPVPKPNNTPPGGGIYRIYDCKDKHVYTGITGSFNQRMGAHGRGGGMLSAFACCGKPPKVKFEPWPVYNPARAAAREADEIARLELPANDIHNPNRDPSYRPPQCCGGGGKGRR